MERTLSNEDVVNDGVVNYYETSSLALGFTEFNTEPREIMRRFPAQRIVELEQIHSDIIFFSGDIVPESEGDGIVTTTPGHLAIIKTADCGPLFFWNDEQTVGGVIHVGWRGLWKGIEIRLLHILNQHGFSPSSLSFLLGPAIEKSCYEVGPELPEHFAGKHYQREIFSPLEREGEPKFLMDVPLGIIRSLEYNGVSPEKIAISGLCTMCETERFPSYRRAKGTGQRIYNFFLLK